MSDTS